MEFLIAHSIFLLALTGTLILPGVILLSLWPRGTFSGYEILALSVPTSFVLSTLSILIAAKTGMSITRENLLLLFAGLYTILIASMWLRQKSGTKKVPGTSFAFSKKHIWILIAIICGMFAIHTTFLTNTIFPTSTDLGHHMFWVERIVASGDIPIYERIHVLPTNPENAADSPAEFSGTNRVADFIIGEHVIFAAIALLTGQDIVSAFPSLVLYLVHVATIFTMFVLATRLFAPLPYAKNAAIFTLLLIGTLWAISGAGAKFISGGVVGNVFGNMLIALIVYGAFRAFSENARAFLALTIFGCLTLILTHHLSTFILLYTIIFILVSFFVTEWKNFKAHWPTVKNILFTPLAISILLFVAATLLTIHTPSYLNTESISSSVGTPTKSTRTGLPFVEFMYKTGEARFVFGLAGLALLVFAFAKADFFRGVKKFFATEQSLNPFARAILIGWSSALVLMTLFPELLQVNIFSARIATYASFPLALTAAFFLAWIIHKMADKNACGAPYTLATASFALIMSFTVLSGISNSASSLNAAPKTADALQTFHAASYLSSVTPENVWALKDHNYVVADTWMKNFLGRDYLNPLSRSFFQRYENNPRREHCTREMISVPDSELAQRCFENLNVGPIVVNTLQDSGQFERDDSFLKVYENNDSSIFWRIAN